MRAPARRVRAARVAAVPPAGGCTLRLTTGSLPGVSISYRGPRPGGVFFTYPMSTARADGAATARPRWARWPQRRPLRPAGTSPASEPTPEQIGAARSLVRAFRTHGHMAARLDPLGSDPSAIRPSTRPTTASTGRCARAHPGRRARLFVPGETLADVLPRLRETYAGRSRTRSSTSRATPAPAGCARRSSRGAYTQPLPADERRHS